MAYCFIKGNRTEVTSGLFVPKDMSPRGYSPQMKPYTQKVVEEHSLYSKDMIKCFLTIFVILFIIFY